jgi:hypothetical protein
MAGRRCLAPTPSLMRPKVVAASHCRGQDVGKKWAAAAARRGAVPSVFFFSRDLLDQVDNTPAQL